MPPNEEEQDVILTPTSERPRSFFARNSTSLSSDGGETAQPALPAQTTQPEEGEESEEEKERPPKWSMGVLNDPTTHEVCSISGLVWGL